MMRKVMAFLAHVLPSSNPIVLYTVRVQYIAVDMAKLRQSPGE